MAALLHGLVVSPALAAVQISGWKSSQRAPSAVAAGGRGARSAGPGVPC